MSPSGELFASGGENIVTSGTWVLARRLPFRGLRRASGQHIREKKMKCRQRRFSIASPIVRPVLAVGRLRSWPLTHYLHRRDVLRWACRPLRQSYRSKLSPSLPTGWLARPARQENAPRQNARGIAFSVAARPTTLSAGRCGLARFFSRWACLPGIGRGGKMRVMSQPAPADINPYASPSVASASAPLEPERPRFRILALDSLQETA